MALTLYKQALPNQASPSGGLTLFKQPQKPSAKPVTQGAGYTTIGGKSYPTASIVKAPPKPTNIFESAKSVFTNIRNAVNNKLSEKIGLKKDEGLGAPIGRALQKVSNIDLGTKGQKIFKATDTETKIVNFISNFPSAIAQGLGQSLEQVSTKEGKQRLKIDAKNLPKTMGEIKTHIDNREWQKALETAMSNSALVVGLDVASFIPAGLITKGLKGSLGLRKTAQIIVKEGIEEAEKTVIKTTAKVIEPIKPKVIPSGIEGGIKVEPKVEIIKPIGEGEIKVSKLGLRVEQTAIEKKLVKELGDLPDFKQMNMKEQAKMASNLIRIDEDRAVRIALGQEEPPKGLLAQSVFKAMEGSITTPEMARKLATSPLVSEASALGQKIKALDVGISDSPVKAMQDVIQARKKALEGRYGTIDKATERITKDIQSKVKIPNKYDWNKFIEGIQC